MEKGSGYEILVEDGNEYSLVELVFSVLFGVYCMFDDESCQNVATNFLQMQPDPENARKTQGTVQE